VNDLPRRAQDGWAIQDWSTEPLPYRVTVYGHFPTSKKASDFAENALRLGQGDGRVFVNRNGPTLGETNAGSRKTHFGEVNPCPEVAAETAMSTRDLKSHRRKPRT
jgi:hypothetical protein